jgi:hypothetical protein
MHHPDKSIVGSLAGALRKIRGGRSSNSYEDRIASYSMQYGLLHRQTRSHSSECARARRRALFASEAHIETLMWTRQCVPEKGALL